MESLEANPGCFNCEFFDHIIIFIEQGFSVMFYLSVQYDFSVLVFLFQDVTWFQYQVSVLISIAGCAGQFDEWFAEEDHFPPEATVEESQDFIVLERLCVCQTKHQFLSCGILELAKVKTILLEVLNRFFRQVKGIDHCFYIL